MLISKTPYRISLFGGGTDFPEYFNDSPSIVIGGAIDKFVYITINKQFSKITKNNIKIFYKNVEFVDSIKLIKHKVIKNALKLYNLRRDIEIHIASDLPSFTGLGSSSAFSAGLINLLEFFFEKDISPRQLADKTIHFERKILNESVGLQDQILSAYGGFNIIKFKKNKFIVEKIISKKKLDQVQNNLLLVFTGLTRKADNIEKIKIKKIKSNKKYLNKINEIAIRASEILKSKSSKKLDEIGNLLDETWHYKKKLSPRVTNKIIDKIYSLGKKNGALGGKLLGAGAGGFILFYVTQDKRSKLIKALKKYSCIDFNFISSGSEVTKL